MKGSTKLVPVAIGLSLALLIFFLLWGSFGEQVLDDMDTIATHSNMTTAGTTVISNSTTMYAMIGFIFIIAVFVGLFKAVGVI